jgi:ubiquinone biosynthesis protein
MIDLIHSLSKKGPIYVKVLQSLSGNTGFLSPAVQDFLTKFSDSVPYDSDEEQLNYIYRRLEFTRGKYPNLVVSNVSEKPIHSGTVSLVYSARMGDTPVVIKCNRSGIRVKMIRAIEEAEYVIAALELIPSIHTLSLSRILSENRVSLIDQTSMSYELSNLTELRRNVQDRGYVVTPKPYPEFTESFDDMLVMERLSGKQLDDVNPEDNEAYGTLIAQQCVDSIIKDGVYHADLHRGNILFIDDGGVKKIGLLDFGIMGRLSESEKLTLSSFFISLGMGNYDDVVNSLLGTIVNADTFAAMNPIERKRIISDLVTLTEDACASKDGFTPQHMRQINDVFTQQGLQLASVFCRIELALAMNMSVSKTLETKEKNYMSYLRSVIKDKMDLSAYDV